MADIEKRVLYIGGVAFAKKMADSLAEQLKLKTEWVIEAEDYCMGKFKRKGGTGKIYITPNAIDILVTLSWWAKPWKKGIEEAIDKWLINADLSQGSL